MKYMLPFLMIGMAHAAPGIIEAPLDHLFIPSGFDNNDTVEVVVTGVFPNSCYSRNKVTVDQTDDTIKIHVNSLLTSPDDQSKCLPMQVPFKEVVNVGNLQAGSYKVVANEASSNLKDSLEVTEAPTNSVDDHIYAQVDYIDLGFAGGAGGSAFLMAQLPSPCLEFDRVEYVSNGKDTLSILPIMKKVSDFCPMKMVPYIIPIKFNAEEFASKKVLLFSRTIEGKSVNTIMYKE